MKNLLPPFISVFLGGLITFSPSLLASEPVQPLNSPAATVPALTELGKKLYFEPRLSSSGILSCNSCHNLTMAGTDRLPRAIGQSLQPAGVNTPTTLNTDLAFMWSNRIIEFKSVDSPPSKEASLYGHQLDVSRIAEIPAYRAAFVQEFDTKVLNVDLVIQAIAEFNKTLVTPGARFDHWLQGDENAISDIEKAGYRLFKSSGCIACHNGRNLGGNSFHRMGIVQPYEAAKGLTGVTDDDVGRFNFFKVPALRNVELTAPYFHDGQAKTLDDAVDIMGRLQLGKHFSAEETAQIVAFLQSLTGEIPTIELPQLP